MADLIKRFAKGTAAASGSDRVYTVPSNKAAIVKAITLCNNSSTSDVKVYMKFASVYIMKDYVLRKADTVTIPFIDQVIESGETIDMLASLDNTVSYYISGREVDA